MSKDELTIVSEENTVLVLKNLIVMQETDNAELRQRVGQLEAHMGETLKHFKASAAMAAGSHIIEEGLQAGADHETIAAIFPDAVTLGFQLGDMIHQRLAEDAKPADALEIVED
jgi:hypothetical protein